MNFEPLLYLIAHAPPTPEWFEPAMPEARPSTPSDVPERLLMAAYWCHYVTTGNELTFPQTWPEIAWAKENGPAFKKAAQWDVERDHQKAIQWPAAWAKEQLRQINVQFQPGAPGMVPMYIHHDENCGYPHKA